MADIAYSTDVAYRNNSWTTGRSTDWGAIWAGVFAFAAIWSVFGTLGEAIFASSANPNAAQPVSGMSVGMGIWSIILTIIAMFVAGRVTVDLARAVDRGRKLLYANAMFGLSVVSSIVLLSLAGAVLSGGTGVAGGPHSGYTLTILADLGWIGFVALFLGWLAAMGGASSGAKSVVRTSGENIREIRPAA